MTRRTWNAGDLITSALAIAALVFALIATKNQMEIGNAHARLIKSLGARVVQLEHGQRSAERQIGVLKARLFESEGGARVK